MFDYECMNYEDVENTFDFYYKGPENLQNAKNLSTTAHAYSLLF